MTYWQILNVKFLLTNKQSNIVNPGVNSIAIFIEILIIYSATGLSSGSLIENMPWNHISIGCFVIKIQLVQIFPHTPKEKRLSDKKIIMQIKFESGI